MMETPNPRIRAMLRQAERVAESGKRAAAEKLYRQIIEEAPNQPAAWLGLAAVVRDPASQREAYERALALDPDNAAARQALEQERDEPSPEPVELADVSAFDQARDWLNQETARRRFDDLDGHDRRERPSKPAPVDRDEAPVAVRTADAPIDQLETDELFCYRHPKRPTSLRCISCGQPICSRCAQHTPVGYRCPVCIREKQDVFYSAGLVDYILAPLVALPLSLLAGYLVVRLSGGFFFIFLMLFVGGAIGSLIGRVAHRVAGRRRGRYLPYLVAGTVVLGVLIPALPILLAILFGNFGAFGALIVPAIYLFVATSAAFYAMR